MRSFVEQHRGGKKAALAVCLLVLWHTSGGLALAETQALTLTIVEGEGAINNIRQRVARDPIVQVEDENRKPVAGAVVTFLLPGDGPSAAFSDGSRSITVTTGPDGRAAARGLRPNNVAGEMRIRVTASFEGRTASTIITQTNSLGLAAGAGIGISAKILALVAVAGAAAAIGAVAATKPGDGNGATGGATGSTATVIRPGTPSVGGPR